jgi:hypothetical protein
MTTFLIGIYFAGFIVALCINKLFNVLSGSSPSYLSFWSQIVFKSALWPIALLKFILKK